MTDTTKNPFDFDDVSDLPEALASKLAVERDTANAEKYAGIFSIEGAPTSMNINKVMAVATRLGWAVPTQATVRNYLNTAIGMGLLEKPGRQTYGLPGTAGTEEDASDDVELENEFEPEDDADVFAQ